MLQKKKIIVLRLRSLPQPFQNPPIRPLGQLVTTIARTIKTNGSLLGFDAMSSPQCQVGCRPLEFT
jgi:hypothetical protein